MLAYIATPLLATLALSPLVAADMITTAPAMPSHVAYAKRQASTQVVSAYPTTGPLPLSEYFYPLTAVPYQVNPYPVGRGPQSGYNICNSTTEGPASNCQTSFVNSIEDFCFWGAPGTTGGQEVADIEAAVVSYCSRSGHGSRIFPEGTFSAVQFLKTPAYIQVTGLFNQTAIGLDPTDGGGELDPHGADGLGNAIGSLMYSNGFESGNNSTYIQTQSWNNFIGSNQFCMKLCDPNYNTPLNYCENKYDIIGCNYNMPAAYEPGAFLSCDSDLQEIVGTYVSGGQTLTWSQPASLPANSVLPWTPVIPASSNCVTYQSSQLFPASNLGYQATALALGAAATTTAATSAATGTAAVSRTGASSGAAATSTTKSTSGAVSTSSSMSALLVSVVFGLVAILN
ncbi:hypothetical protein FRB97_001092 [Tulasnella sp. 331]|nr:hypothetical protein FRB97_001092 [Tulasnella sp. 331]